MPRPASVVRVPDLPPDVSPAAWRGGQVSPEQLKGLLRQGRVALVDVRTDEEVRSWPMPGALHVPLDALPREHGKLPTDRPLVTVCSHGRRSAAAAQFLAGKGFAASSLVGGMTAWSGTFDIVPLPVRDGAVLQVRRLGKGCLSYVIVADGEAAVLDPSCHLEATVRLLHERGWAVKHVADTHRHADHLSGAAELARALGAQLHLPARDGYEPDGWEPAEEGLRLHLGPRKALALEARATPGHTPGSLTYLLPGEAAFTGDALFLDGVGRPDLRDQPEAHARALHATYQKMASWESALQVLPAHLSPGWPLSLGRPAARPLGEVREALGVFALPEAEFVQRVLARLPARPANYQAILELNKRGGPHDPDTVEELEAGGNQCVVPQAPGGL
jgi:glyoxylase-like metal-dependent hydrolase (beta-lactamase superfamily II)